MNEMNNRVCCLYRVSTDKQVDFNSNHEAGLPMQRKACHKFAEAKGWVIVHEEQEEGVSGHKVRAEARDKLQIIKEYARKGKFDILLVFMFDRIGRIADETPFVVEWFVRNGIRVWSTQEGEQRFDNHTDKLLNYIRFWQADGESEKTSVRTRTSLRQAFSAVGMPIRNCCKSCRSSQRSSLKPPSVSVKIVLTVQHKNPNIAFR